MDSVPYQVHHADCCSAAGILLLQMVPLHSNMLLLQAAQHSMAKSISNEPAAQDCSIAAARIPAASLASSSLLQTAMFLQAATEVAQQSACQCALLLLTLVTFLFQQRHITPAMPLRSLIAAISSTCDTEAFEQH
jgi:hypothetical protein